MTRGWSCSSRWCSPGRSRPSQAPGPAHARPVRRAGAVAGAVGAAARLGQVQVERIVPTPGLAWIEASAPAPDLNALSVLTGLLEWGRHRRSRHRSKGRPPRGEPSSLLGFSSLPCSQPCRPRHARCRPMRSRAPRARTLGAPRTPPTTTIPPTTPARQCHGRVVNDNASGSDVGRCTTTTTTATTAAPATTVAPVTIEPSDTTEATAQTGEDALPFTGGGSSVPTLVVGVLLLAAGALALAGTRRAPRH
jgi:hypothetical protein